LVLFGVPAVVEPVFVNTSQERKPNDASLRAMVTKNCVKSSLWRMLFRLLKTISLGITCSHPALKRRLRRLIYVRRV